MTTLRCILATVREEVGNGPTDAALARALGDAAGELAKRGLGSITTTNPDIYAPLVAEAVARVRRGEDA